MKLFSALILLLCQQQSCVVVVDADQGQAGHVRVFDWNDDGDTPFVCPEIFDPVWCEGKEYSNKCFAKAAGFVKSHCNTDGNIFCLTVFEPVWCQGKVNVERKKYSNQCFAKAEGFTESQCTDKDPTTPIGCPKNIDPVFCEGIKYDNLCFAEAAEFVESQCTVGDDICLTVVERVWCQGNINTAVVEYSNLCLATAVGFKKSQCTDEDPDVKDTLDDECEDDENFRKGKKGNKKKKKNCAAYLQNNGERRCNKNHKGGKVYDFCVKTCNEFGLGDCGVFGLD